MLPENTQTYADTAFEVALTLRAQQQFFPSARVAAAFSRYDLHPSDIDTTDPRTRVYKLTVYDPPGDVAHILRDMLGNTGTDIVEVTAACRALRSAGPPTPREDSECESCEWFDSEVQALADVAGAFTARGDRKLAAVSTGSLEAMVADYQAHIRRDHGPGNLSLLQRYDAVLMIHNFGALSAAFGGRKREILRAGDA
jgi:hypothetical protein